MRISEEHAPQRPPAERPSRTERVREAASPVGAAVALVGLAIGCLLAGRNPDDPLVILGIALVAGSAYAFGMGARPDVADLRARAKRYERERDLAIAELLRDDRRADAPRGAAPAAAGGEPVPIGRVPRGGQRGGFDAAAALDSLDAAVRGDDPRAFEADLG